MIEVTPKATQLMTNYFKNHKTEPVRIFVKMGGCGMRSLGVALESVEKSDDVFEIDGFTYIVDRRLLRKNSAHQSRFGRHLFSAQRQRFASAQWLRQLPLYVWGQRRQALFRCLRHVRRSLRHR